MIKHRLIKSGFTMIELLVVATIIIVLTTIGLVSYQRSTRSSRNAKRQADLETTRQALVFYWTDESIYPLGDGSAGAFTTMLSTLSDYLSFVSLTDPKDTPPYQYTYESDGSTFSVCSYLETDAGSEQYCVTNP